MDTKVIKPPALKKGDTIGVMATSCWIEEQDLLKAKAAIEAKGYKVKIHPQSLEREHQSAGSGKSKAAAFHDLLRDDEVKAIISARGGNRSHTMMEYLDFKLIAQKPKILMGYSDVSLLLNAIFNEVGLATFHGPLFRELPNRKEFDQVMDVLAGGTPTLDFKQATALREGMAEGQLIGGNLSLLQSMSGTPYQPDTNGALLFIEDIGDHISRYDRMFAHLKNAGWLDGIAGLIVGDFSDTKDDEDRAFGYSLRDIIEEHTKGLDIPIIMDAPFGHGDDLPCMPVGGKAKLVSESGKSTLELTAPAVSV